jgi:hypothetical protein
MKNKKDAGKKSRVNWKIVICSLIGLGFIGLGFFVNYLFFIGAVVCTIINQREIMRKR